MWDLELFKIGKVSKKVKCPRFDVYSLYNWSIRSPYPLSVVHLVPLGTKAVSLFHRCFKLVPIASLSIMTLILLLSVSPIVYNSSIVLGELCRQAQGPIFSSYLLHSARQSAYQSLGMVYTAENGGKFTQKVMQPNFMILLGEFMDWTPWCI